jgi:photosystem II stability/assembly factor-like uncharacterized protein
MDGGQTWDQLPLSGVREQDRPRKIKHIIIDPSDTAKIYLGNDCYYKGGIYISHDNGTSWETRKLYNYTEEITALACTPAGYENHTVCAIVQAGAIDREFHISQDSGLTWTEIAVPSTMALGGNIRDNAIYISPDYPEWVYIGADYENNDRRSSIIAYNLEDNKWYYITGAPHTYPTSILSCNEVDYLGFRYQGVYRYSAIDTTWHQKQKGMNCGEVYDLAVNPMDPNKVMVAIRSNLARTKDGGGTWDLDDRDFSALAISQKDTSFILGGSKPPYYLPYGASFSYYKGSNNGADWTKHLLFTRTGLFDYDYKMWTGDILIFPSDPDRFIFGIDGGGGAGEGIYITEDGGSSWLVNYGTGVSTLAQDPNDENIVYLGTTALGYVHRSTQGGKDWERISPGGQNAFVNSVWDLAVDKNGKVLAATSEGLFEWEGGTTWNPVQGVPSVDTRAVVIDNQPSTPVYYVGTKEQGIFRSVDGGSNWEDFNLGIGSESINKLKINNTYPRNLYAGTTDAGVWVTRLQESAVHNQNIPEEDISITVFPNPSNGTFSIVSGSDYKLSGEITIIDLMGKVVYADARFDIFPGSSRHLSLDNLAAGHYILLFRCDKVILKNQLIISNDP